MLNDIPAVYALTAVIQGVTDVGNQIMEQDGVMMRLMKLAQSSNYEAQVSACGYADVGCVNIT